ncbi:MAG: VCBS repeat-containing protein [Bacteroidetes bacterium]|nr:VCBS repeat-containing protein [Bacteroidota bacterium]
MSVFGIGFLKKYNFTIVVLLSLVFLFGCSVKTEKKQDPLFEVLDDNQTGLNFNNKLTPTQDFNVFKYMYYYNGGGIGAGDFNNDGKIDVFFAGNQTNNRLFLNTGSLKFKDVTVEAKIPADGAWSTGVSVVDINNDGLLDIYICRVGNHETLHSKNQLLICQGIDGNGVPYYKDEAKEYGLDFSGFSTQAVFVDYDMDGDLDMYLLNHSIHQNGTFGARNEKLQTHSPVSGDHLFRNDGNNHFTDVTKESGINSSVIGYGLGIAAADINLDGYPDLYIGNDFHENDYMYINQRNGSFKDELNDRVMHTSQFSMGVDVADVNNDGYPDVMTVDMLPSDPYILKRSLGEDTYDIFNLKLGYGYNHQYTRNNLQLNRRNGMFSEVGLYAGVAATDWSWSPLWVDFDNDGLKDLFISNGIPKRLNDIDFVNFIENETIQEKMRTGGLDKRDMDLIDKFPQIKIPNKFFKNQGNLQFEDMKDAIEKDKKTYSNGAIYADFDNDGDLDVLVNNIDEPALLYENKSNDKKEKAFVEIKLKGPEKNINALGAKVIIYANAGIRTYEKYPVRGFLSSAEIPIHIGLDKTKIDSAFLVWPDNTYQPIQLKADSPWLKFSYQKGLPKFDYQKITKQWKYSSLPMEDITDETHLLYKHEENSFHEFDREPLMPHMLSTEGPALTVADMNGDGLEDVFIGSSKWKKSVIFFQDRSGKFVKSKQPDLENDSTKEDVDACVADVNHDGKPDLIVASGGNEFYGNDVNLSPRVYLNDGGGHFKKKEDAFDNLFMNASCVISYDFNGDGYTDLFIGGRSVPANYGQIPRSYLLQNDGTGRFKDVTEQYCKELSHVGFVTKALWFDLDKDGHKDLILSLEWGGILAFINHPGSFSKKVITNKKGWWNFIMPVDLNHDGNIDFIAGNLGLNSRLKASEKEPVRLYYNDFDDNGKKEQLLTYYLQGRELPFANKEELEKQMPVLKKKFLYAADFAKASLKELFSASKLESADLFTADYFSNAVLMNDGHLNFTTKALPWEAQLTPYRDAVVVNANNDSLPDILLVGNYYESNIEMGRYDADYGTILINHGKGSFSAEGINGLAIKGQVRHVSKINIANKQAFILARNDDSTMVIKFKK